MALDFLVWTKGLARKAEVLRIAASTGRHRFWVAGQLMELWEWAEDQTEDGKLHGVTVPILSRICPETDAEFWGAVQRVGWLEPLGDDGVLIPRFDRWMGKSAKIRLKEREKKRQTRSKLTQMSPKIRDKIGTNKGTKSGQRPPKIGTTNTSTNTNTSTEELPPFPPELDSEKFRKAWGEWLAYRTRIKKPLKPESHGAQLGKLARFGEAVALRAIEDGIANGWQGLFPEKVRLDGPGDVKDLEARVEDIFRGKEIR